MALLCSPHSIDNAASWRAFVSGLLPRAEVRVHSCAQVRSARGAQESFGSCKAIGIETGGFGRTASGVRGNWGPPSLAGGTIASIGATQSCGGSPRGQILEEQGSTTGARFSLAGSPPELGAHGVAAALSPQPSFFVLILAPCILLCRRVAALLPHCSRGRGKPCWLSPTPKHHSLLLHSYGKTAARGGTLLLERLPRPAAPGAGGERASN